LKVSNAIGEKYFTHTLNAQQSQMQHQATQFLPNRMSCIDDFNLRRGNQR